MKTIIKSLIFISILFVNTAYAHVGLESSTPKNNAMLMASPKKLDLNFSGEVRLIKVVLKKNKGQKIDFGFKPQKQAQKSFSWALPKLSPANYEVEWTIMGKDGHLMKNKLGFMVH